MAPAAPRSFRERLRLLLLRLWAAWNFLCGRPVNEDPGRRATYTPWDADDPLLR